MSAQIVNTIGLCFGIVGVAMIFFWGPPQPILDSGMGLGLEDETQIDDSGKTVAEYDKEISARRCRHWVVSGLGLGFVGFGFVLQLLATWM